MNPPDDARKLDALNGKHVFFATPSKDWSVSVAFHESMTRTRDVLRELGVLVTSRFMLDGGILLARSRLAMEAVASPATHVFFIDADLAFRPEDVARLLAHDVPLVGGHYAHREVLRGEALPGAADLIGPTSVLAPCRPRLMMRADTSIDYDEARGLFKTNALTGGFMCMRRDVLEESIAAARGTERDLLVGKERVVLVFDRELVGDAAPYTWASEDTGFCLRWIGLGGGRQPYLDGRCRFEHVGPASYASPTVEELVRLKWGREGSAPQ